MDELDLYKNFDSDLVYGGIIKIDWTPADL